MPRRRVAKKSLIALLIRDGTLDADLSVWLLLFHRGRGRALKRLANRI
jgi:hypothetical protein